MVKNNKLARMIMAMAVMLSIVISMGLVLVQNSVERVQLITEVNELNESFTGFVYFGRPTCPSCKLFEPILELIAREKGVGVKYFNSDYFRKEAKVADDELMKVFEKYNVVRIPLLAYIKDGEMQEAFGSELSGNKDQSAAYKEVSAMISNITQGGNVKTQYVSCLMLAIGVILFQVIGVKTRNISTKMNYILGLSLLASLSFSVTWFLQFKSSGLDLIKDDKILSLACLLTIVLTAVLFLKNKKMFRKEN